MRFHADLALRLSFDAGGDLTSAEVHEGGEGSPTAVLATTIALSFLGTPFKFGGATPETGFDAPGLTQYAYGQAGVTLPRTADQQFLVGQPVEIEDLLAGDPVFFQDSGGFVYHVGISLGDGTFVHAGHAGDVVQISSLSEPLYAIQLAGARRVA